MPFTDKDGQLTLAFQTETRKPCYRKDDRVMRPIYKLFTLILSTLTATIHRVPNNEAPNFGRNFVKS